MQHPIERHRQIVTESGLDLRPQVAEHDLGDRQEFDPLLDVAERQPDQFHKLGIGADLAVDAMRDGGGIGGEEACVVAAGPARRRDCASDEMDAGEVRTDVGLGERRPRAA